VLHRIIMLHRIVQNTATPYRMIRHYEGSSLKTMCCRCHAFLYGDWFATEVNGGMCEACVKRLYPETYREEDFADIRDEVGEAA
jgi:hypothetical protein